MDARRQRRIVLAANSAWNIVHFRPALVQALQRERFEPLIVAPADADDPRSVEALGVALEPVAINRSGLSIWDDLRLFVAYVRILRRIDPAAFLGFTIKPNIYGSLAARLLGIPAIANISGLGTAFMTPGLLTRFVAALYRFALKRTPVVFFQNADDRALFLAKVIVREDQARLLPGSGIDLDAFAPAPLPPGPVTFLLIARLLGDKGVREFVAAALMVKRDHPDAAFQLLGAIDPGNRSAIARDELDCWVADGAIDYLGHADDVRSFVRAASVIVLPSYREGLPRSLLEGAAMARPLIASDVPGCRDVVRDGVNGFLCPSHNPLALAEAMRKLIALPEDERRRMGVAGRALAEARFGIERVVDAYLDALAYSKRPRSKRWDLD